MRAWQSLCFSWCQTQNDLKLFQDVDETSNRGCTQAIHSVLMFAAQGQAKLEGWLLQLGWRREALWWRAFICPVSLFSPATGNVSYPQTWARFFSATSVFRRAFQAQQVGVWTRVAHSFNQCLWTASYVPSTRRHGIQALRTQTKILALLKLTWEQQAYHLAWSACQTLASSYCFSKKMFGSVSSIQLDGSFSFPVSPNSWKALETSLEDNLDYDPDWLPDLFLRVYLLRSLETCRPWNP